MNFDDLPGGRLIQEGLRDLAEGRETTAALLVLIGAPRLRRVGIAVSGSGAGESSPEHRLYERLATENSNAAHSLYNALIRVLVSFERAAESRVYPSRAAALRAALEDFLQGVRDP